VLCGSGDGSECAGVGRRGGRGVGPARGAGGGYAAGRECARRDGRRAARGRGAALFDGGGWLSAAARERRAGVLRGGLSGCAGARREGKRQGAGGCTAVGVSASRGGVRSEIRSSGGFVRGGLPSSVFD